MTRRPAPTAGPTIAVPLALFEALVTVTAERFSKAGHVMQLVTNESRGYCTPRGCRPICLGHQATLHAAYDALVRAGVLDPIGRPRGRRGARAAAVDVRS